MSVRQPRSPHSSVQAVMTLVRRDSRVFRARDASPVMDPRHKCGGENKFLLRGLESDIIEGDCQASAQADVYPTQTFVRVKASDVKLTSVAETLY